MLMIAEVVLAVGFIVTVVPDETKDQKKREEATRRNNAWVSAFNQFATISYFCFLFFYITTLSLLKVRLKKYFPDFYKSQRRQFMISSMCLLFSISFKIFMRLQKILI